MTLRAGEPVWLTFEQIVAVHATQIVRFGGAVGLRDEGLVRSALERSRHKWLYEQAPLAELGAALAFGLIRNHGFFDGNKRIAFLAMMIFLRMNGIALAPPPAEAAAMFVALAAGEVSEAGLTRWIQNHMP